MVDENADPQGTGQGSAQAGDSTGQGSGDQDKTSQEALNLAAKKLGFPDFEKLQKTVKESHATITRLSTEVKAKDREMAVLAAQARTEPANPRDPQVQIRNAVKAEVASVRVNDLLEKEPPENHRPLRQLMLQELADNPHLENHPDAIKELFRRAKERMEQDKERVVKALFGEDVVLDDLKAIVKERKGKKGEGEEGGPEGGDDKLRSGFLPEGGSAPRGSGKSKEDRWAEEQRKAMNDGDVDAVIDFTFRDTSKIIKPRAGEKRR